MKRLFKLICVLILGINIYSNAQDIPDFLLLGKNPNVENKASFSLRNKYPQLLRNSAIVRRPYDVISYDLFMDWYNVLSSTGTDSAGRVFTGKNSIQLKIDSANVTSIELDAVDLLIDSIIINSNKLNTTPQPGDGILSIPLPNQVKQGDIVGLDIFYKYISNKNIGMYIFAKGTVADTYPTPEKIDTAFVEERIAYTMSEPSDARYWMPCNDAPYDKAKSKISVRVPNKYTVASNGLLSKIETMQDSSRIYYWGDTTQITTYLMMATSSIFHEFSDWYHKRNNYNDSIEVKYYVWDKDYKNQAGDVYVDSIDGAKFNAVHTFSSVVNMMENFASKYIEFPFVKYGMNAVQPFYYGGMEHQTMTTINRSWLRNMYYYWNKQTQAYQGYNVYYSNLQGIAHELSHMWTGDLITCATWHDIWINEGGATWSEAIWSEGLWGLDAYYSNMLGKKNTYLNYGGLSLPSNYDVSFADVFNGGLTYAKGGWIWHMLRTMLGDSVYFPAFRNLLHRDGYTSVETEDIKKSFEMDVPNPPVSFETYFDQWIYKAGHPIYDITYSSINVGPNNYKITVNINQTQDTSGNISRIPYVFIMPITFMSYEKDSIKHYDTLINNQRNQTAEFYLPFKPDSIQLDERLILCEVKSIVSTVKEISDNSYTDNISIYPNPIYSGNEGNYSLRLNNYSNLSAEIYDELGNRVQTIYQGFLPTGTYSLNFSTSNLATGVYILNCKTRDKVFSHSFSVIK